MLPLYIEVEDLTLKLIISEKPAQAFAYAKTLGVKGKKDGYLENKDYIITWCVGHLVALAEPSAYNEKYKKWSYDDLPLLPDKFKYVVPKEKQKQFKVVKWLMNRKDVTEIVNGCDAGREGELIFRLVYIQAGCDKPFKRLWISSMEESAIRYGMENLRSRHDYDNLYYSALCRLWADWIVGINATRLFSLLYKKTLNIGRVQTPTLALLHNRHNEITFFKKEKFYKVVADLGSFKAETDRIDDGNTAISIANECSGNTFICNNIERVKKVENPPKLFDLTTLQREANKIFGLTAKQTLDLAQSLYEKKLITYPRTDSRYLTTDMAETVSVLIRMCAKMELFNNIKNFYTEISHMIDDKKVSDHHAIIPTAEIEKTDFSELSNDEMNILNLIICRLLSSAAEPYIYENLTATFNCGTQKFTTKTKAVISLGFKEIEHILHNNENDDEPVILCCEEGQVFSDVKAEYTEHFTSPPKPYTEDTLLSAMENASKKETNEGVERKGLGTPATRAGIIEKLVQIGFAERKGKQIFPTKHGNLLISVLPETLTSASLTAEWENTLLEIAQGKSSSKDFMDGIKKEIKELVKRYPCISMQNPTLFEDKS